jgi:hypothetical protein
MNAYNANKNGQRVDYEGTKYHIEALAVKLLARSGRALVRFAYVALSCQRISQKLSALALPRSY